MKKYYLEGLDHPNTYKLFVRTMCAYSSAFSLVYFRYTENEKQKRSCRTIKERLKPYKISKRNTNVMPSMITGNWLNHIYELTFYRVCFETADVLESVKNLYEWDYPKHPMDLCFFKDGYAWFISSAHEFDCTLYTNDSALIRGLQSLGIQVEQVGEIDEASLFYEQDTII